MSTRYRWKYRTYPRDDGERFAVYYIQKRKRGKRTLHFWHINAGHEMLYTFRPNKKYNRKSEWSEDLCRELVSDLHSPQPGIKVLRYVVDGMVVFLDEEYTGLSIPKTPEAPKYSESWDVYLRRQKLSPTKEQMTLPAPYFLIGKHYKNDYKEYAWKLFPDILERQDIEPGDRVIVQTSRGNRTVIVLRIEEAANREQPTCCVICKKECCNKTLL